jgi:spermidine synthase
MKPHITLAETKTPEGQRLTLQEHDGRYAIRLDGLALMESSQSASEGQLGELATAHLTRTGPGRVLIGGLGLGFTLRKVLEKIGPKASVVVTELLPAVVAWNRTFLRGLNGALLEDRRVKCVAGDVGKILARTLKPEYDAIILDIDNGPAAMVRRNNRQLYEAAGLQGVVAALKPGGRAAFWSAGADRAFEKRMIAAGLVVEVVAARLHPGARRAAATLYIGTKPKPIET